MATKNPPERASRQTIHLHSLPTSTFLGLDLLSLSTSPNFHGIRNLPPGYHFLYSAPNPSLSIRHGQWFVVSGTENPPPSVWRWSEEEEDVQPEADEDTADEVRRRLTSVGDTGFVNYLDPGKQGELANDGEEHAQEWAKLSSFVKRPLLDRIFENRQRADGHTWRISSVSSGRQDVEVIPGLEPSEAVIEGENRLNFLPIDLKKTWPEGAVGRERTLAAQDRSWYFGHLIQQAAGSTGDRKLGAASLLGELQLCFLMVLTLANWSCLEQWKRILGVLLTCQKALGEVTQYFVEVVKVLGLQLRHCDDVEGGLFDFKEDGAPWLRGLLNGFRHSVEECTGSDSLQTLREELQKVEDYLSDHYGWNKRTEVLKRGLLELEDGEKVEMDLNGVDEEDETGEYAPVVVDIS